MKSVTVIGAGIAGLSAAVFLKERNYDVTLIESSPKLGGRAYSVFDSERKQFFDNGQHILAGWCKNTFEYLKIIGTLDKLNFQKELEVNFINTDKKIYRLKCPNVSPPMNLILGLIKFDAFNWKDKAALRNIKNLFDSKTEYEKKFANVRELLMGLDQTANLIKYFWEPFTLAIFNTRLEKIDADIFLNVFRIGFEEKKNSTLVIPDANLNELLIDGAVKYFKKNSVNVLLDKAVKQISVSENEVECLILEDEAKLNSDFYISTVPFFAFKRLFDEKVFIENEFKSDLLKTSGIVSVHLFFGNDIDNSMIPDNSFGMTGLIGTIVQWIFKRNKRHLSLVISGADDLQITDMQKEDIFRICVDDLKKTLNGFEELMISDYIVIKEKRATFVPDFHSNEMRPLQSTKYKNFFIAGDWTNTGLPSTIESAVTSAKICVGLIENVN
jgi:squalene-associated FAD-dependent desaturase